jgi:hypothetical protein
MVIDFPHDLTEPDARSRLKVLGEYLHGRHGISIDWVDDNRAKFHGKYLVVKIDGELTMDPGYVRFRGKDPGFLWRKKALEYIEGKLRSYLDPKRPIAELPRS